MGTNFGWITSQLILPTGEEVPIDRYDPAVHIGKRSAGGTYCWDCDVTLCKGGNADIHYNRSGWYEACPKCGATPVPVSMSRGSGAVELGFAKPNTVRPTGCSSTSSFSWAQDPERVRAVCAARLDEPLIEDEYGRILTGQEFLVMLKSNCAVEYLGGIGTVFS